MTSAPSARNSTVNDVAAGDDGAAAGPEDAGLDGVGLDGAVLEGSVLAVAVLEGSGEDSDVPLPGEPPQPASTRTVARGISRLRSGRNMCETSS
ncbi:hypothetical protein [Arthrobacter sp. Z1-15]